MLWSAFVVIILVTREISQSNRRFQVPCVSYLDQSLAALVSRSTVNCFLIPEIESKFIILSTKSSPFLRIYHGEKKVARFPKSRDID